MFTWTKTSCWQCCCCCFFSVHQSSSFPKQNAIKIVLLQFFLFSEHLLDHISYDVHSSLLLGGTVERKSEKKNYSGKEQMKLLKFNSKHSTVCPVLGEQPSERNYAWMPASLRQATTDGFPDGNLHKIRRFLFVRNGWYSTIYCLSLSNSEKQVANNTKKDNQQSLF